MHAFPNYGNICSSTKSNCNKTCIQFVIVVMIIMVMVMVMLIHQIVEMQCQYGRIGDNVEIKIMGLVKIRRKYVIMLVLLNSEKKTNE